MERRAGRLAAGVLLQASLCAAGGRCDAVRGGAGRCGAGWCGAVRSGEGRWGAARCGAAQRALRRSKGPVRLPAVAGLPRRPVVQYLRCGPLMLGGLLLVCGCPALLRAR